MGLSHYRVLIVDDESMVRDITVRNLKRLGFECVTAEDGMAASEILATQQSERC